MLVYHPNGSRVAVEFRETAPSAATVDMFHSNSTLSTDVSYPLHHYDIIDKRVSHYITMTS